MAATGVIAALPNGRRLQQKVADCLGCAHKRARRGGSELSLLHRD